MSPRLRGYLDFACGAAANCGSDLGGGDRDDDGGGGVGYAGVKGGGAKGPIG